MRIIEHAKGIVGLQVTDIRVQPRLWVVIAKIQGRNTVGVTKQTRVLRAAARFDKTLRRDVRMGIGECGTTDKVPTEWNPLGTGNGVDLIFRGWIGG